MPGFRTSPGFGFLAYVAGKCRQLPGISLGPTFRQELRVAAKRCAWQVLAGLAPDVKRLLASKPGAQSSASEKFDRELDWFAELDKIFAET